MEELKAQKEDAVHTRDQALDELSIEKKKMLGLQIAFSRKKVALGNMCLRAENAEKELKEIKASVELEKACILKEKEDGIAVVTAQASSQLAKVKRYFDKESKVLGLRVQMNQVRGIIDFLPVLRCKRTTWIFMPNIGPQVLRLLTVMLHFGDVSFLSVTSGVPPRLLSYDMSASGQHGSNISILSPDEASTLKTAQKSYFYLGFPFSLISVSCIFFWFRLCFADIFG